MNLQIEGRTALVLGAGGGLGRAVALALARAGVRLLLADAHAASVQETARQVEAVGTRSHTMIWNLSDLAAFDACLASAPGEMHAVDILFNNTGGPPPTPAAGQPADDWRRNFEQMVLPVIKITDALLPGMRERRWGRVITSTSSGVIAPIPNLGLSNSLRMALVGWSKTLARETAADGVTCNVVVPGRIATPRITALDHAKAERDGRTPDAVSAESIASIPMQRYGEPAEYADMVAFLASERASYVTGSVLRVDGGLLANV